MILDLTKEKRQFLVNVFTCCALFHVLGFNANVHALGPEFDTWVSNVTVVSGQEAILPCNVRHLGEHLILWETIGGTVLTFGSQRITSDTRFRIENPYVQEWNLHIHPVEVTDAGRYKCVVNTEPSMIKYIDLFILVKPQFVGEYSSPSRVTKKEGGTVILYCNVTGIPTPTVQWFRIPMQDKMAPKERLDHKGSVLVIYNVSRACADKYECVASNEVPPSIHREFVLEVEFAPQAFVQPQTIQQKLGRMTVLSCTIEGYPLIGMHWEFKGRQLRPLPGKYHIDPQRLDPISHTSRLSLTISNIEEMDYGDYTCVASNHLGTVKKTASLIREFSSTTRWTDTAKPSNDQPQASVRSTTPLTIMSSSVTDKRSTSPTVGSTKADVSTRRKQPVEPTYKIIDEEDKTANKESSVGQSKPHNTGLRISSSVFSPFVVLVIWAVWN